MLRAASSFHSFRRALISRTRSVVIIGSSADGRQLRHKTLGFASRPDGVSLFVGQRRLLSTTSNDEGGNTTSSFDDTMDKLFANQETTSAVVEATAAATTTASEALPWDPTWYNPADQAINLINWFHTVTELNYAFSIIGLTCIARVILFPVFVKGQRTQSRMAHMQPELQAIKARIDSLGPDSDRETQVKYGMQMKALFKKYDCNPVNAMVLPMIQAPVFMSMFFGLRKMPDYFPEELSTGGMLWFPDLTLPDPYYILPALSSLSFFIMIESGKEQMMQSNPAQGEMMLNVFRGMSIIMFPVATSFSTAVLCYWVTNNTISLAQSMAFRNPTIRKQLGIWEPPKPVPGAEPPKGFVNAIQDGIGKMQGTVVSDEQKMERHNEAIDNKKKARKLSKAARVRRDGRFTKVKR